MNNEINIQSQEIFNTFQDKLDFELSYQNYQKILLLMNKNHLTNIIYYIEKKFTCIKNTYNNYYISYIKMILSYYSDMYCKTNIQNYNFCLEAVKQNGLALEFVSDNIKDTYYNINLEAVIKTNWVLQYVSKQYKDDYNINLKAMKKNNYALKFVSNKYIKQLN